MRISPPSQTARDVPLRGEFETFAQVAKAAGEQFAGHEIYVEGDQRLTFDSWHRAADGMAAHLVELGAKPGDIVAIQLPSSLDYGICCAAALLLGGIATGINTRLGPREIAAILNQALPAFVISEDETVLPPSNASPRTIRRSELAAAYRKRGLGPRRAERRADDPAVIVWTSGTTGVPKGVWYDHRILKAAVRTSGVLSAPFDRRLPATPFAHAGYMSKIWDQVALGVTTVIPPLPWKAATMLRLMVDERITLAAGVPTQWAKLLEQPGLDGADLSNLRLCITASAPAAPELVEEVNRRLRSPIIGRYAMTESPSITGTVPGDDPLVIYRTVGRPVPETEVAIVDEAGREVAAGEVGRVRVRGPCVMRGYWGQPKLTAQAITPDGWLVTGDLGSFDERGNLVLAGRATDMYIRGGYNVYPLEIENVLHEHPGVVHASVVGLAAPVIGEIGVAFVVPVDRTQPPSLAELRDWCKQRLADYKAPDRVEIVAELPLTGIMKIDKAELRKRLAAEAAPPR